jgi:sigma-E factor negative regulatory protein RseC
VTETPGAVLRVDDRFAYVEIGPRVSGCGRCHEAGGCGANWGAGDDQGGKRVYQLPNDIGVCAGDDVVLTMPDGALLRASLLAYFLPIVLVILAAGIGSSVSELAAVGGAGVGLGIGLVLVRYGQSRMLAAREPLLAMRIKTCAFNLPKEHHSC